MLPQSAQFSQTADDSTWLRAPGSGRRAPRSR